MSGNNECCANVVNTEDNATVDFYFDQGSESEISIFMARYGLYDRNMNEIRFLRHFDSIEDAMHYCEKQYYLEFKTLPRDGHMEIYQTLPMRGNWIYDGDGDEVLGEMEEECDRELGQHRNWEDDCPEFGKYQFDYEDRVFLLLFSQDPTLIICLPFTMNAKWFAEENKE